MSLVWSLQVFLYKTANKRIMNANIYRLAVSFESIVFGAGIFPCHDFLPARHISSTVQPVVNMFLANAYPSKGNLNIIITFQF